MTNLIQAICTITTNKIPDVVSFYRNQNKINAAGDALELFVKDIFANTLNEKDEVKKAEIYENLFSYFGNANNPPDFIIKNGDAVEVKKLESETASIALNSSYPSAKLFANSPMITRACRECEQWSTID
jgi:NgoPII restriction endonuclease